MGQALWHRWLSRVDTVKHVEGEVWQRLKAEATSSLNSGAKKTASKANHSG
ncbi:periplasmic alpha-amylase [Vibrio variabilis]|uniref:Periplasmic alpha-amylase n=1 Tax=Vibrio variabilis TaxID=990271 RepID=A0ABQ0JMM5_9VIBR|nr:periplasmic alpha-amylase [Vibrio variabilis]